MPESSVLAPEAAPSEPCTRQTRSSLPTPHCTWSLPAPGPLTAPPPMGRLAITGTPPASVSIVREREACEVSGRCGSPPRRPRFKKRADAPGRRRATASGKNDADARCAPLAPRGFEERRGEEGVRRRGVAHGGAVTSGNARGRARTITRDVSEPVTRAAPRAPPRPRAPATPGAFRSIRPSPRESALYVVYPHPRWDTRVGGRRSYRTRARSNRTRSRARARAHSPPPLWSSVHRSIGIVAR